MTTVTTRGQGKSVNAAKISAAEQLKKGVLSNERVYLDNNEPRVKAWRPVTCSVSPLLTTVGNRPMTWEASIEWEWCLGELTLP